SVQLMLHLTRLPSMKERSHILQAKFLLHSLSLPDHALLTKRLPHNSNLIKQITIVYAI
ncbi:MAG: hypothetical protein EXX96DRAFT_491709, partial [Benjaminiella poitrasii]